MANKNFQKKKIQSTKGGNFGKYQEDVGGGASPEAKDPQQRAPGVNSDYRKSNNDTMQPRTEDGKFTYKSVNGESINPKYGPSRGKTVNPLLTGGENGVMIDDVETEFANQSGKYWDKYKDKWYTKGGEFVTSGDFKVRVAAEAIWDVAKRRYDSVNGEFESESSVFGETKKGRPGKEEQAAKQQAQANGEEQAVINQNTGGIKIKPGVVVQPPKPTQPQPGTQPGTTPIIPNQPTQPTQPTQPGINTLSQGDIENADYTPKYDDNDISQVRDIMKNELGFSDDDLADFDSLSPKQKDAYIDKYFGEDEGEEENTVSSEDTSNNINNNENVAPKEETEEETEAEKKIKKMGFSE